MILNFRNVYVLDEATVAGPYEANGPLKNKFDKKYKDLYCKEKSFEKAEALMLRDSLKILLKKSGLKKDDIDLIVSGDLSNQIAASCYGTFDFKSPFLGIYTACATSVEGILIGSSFIDGGKVDNAIISCSSHNMTSEKQFRNPTEYGSPKPLTATFTATGGAAILLSNKPTKIRIKNGMIGTIVDYNQKDPFNMGSAMAPAAYTTLSNYLKETKTKVSDYDLILTGDLGRYGMEIMKDLMKKDGVVLDNYNDCGVMLYDLEKQKEVKAGGSGPVCSALVCYSSILDKLRDGFYKKVLLIATGALFSPNSLYQKENILAIANLVCLEAI